MTASSPSPSTASLFCVAPYGVDAWWSRVTPLLAKAVDRTPKASLTSVLEDLLAEQMHLWLIFEERHLLAAFVTEIREYPTGHKIVRVLLLGGEGHERWSHLLAEVEAFARAEGCRGVELVGRPGWARVFPDYRETERVLAKEV